MALEELKLLAKIIERKESVRLRQRNYAVTIVAALGVAYYSPHVQLSKSAFLILAALVTVIFWVMETIYHHVEDRAIERSNRVEGSIRRLFPYDGPLIGDSLAPPSLNEQWLYFRKSAFSPRIGSPYIALLTIIAAFWIISL